MLKGETEERLHTKDERSWRIEELIKTWKKTGKDAIGKRENYKELIKKKNNKFLQNKTKLNKYLQFIIIEENLRHLWKWRRTLAIMKK